MNGVMSICHQYRLLFKTNSRLSKKKPLPVRVSSAPWAYLQLYGTWCPTNRRHSPVASSRETWMMLLGDAPRYSSASLAAQEAPEGYGYRRSSKALSSSLFRKTRTANTFIMISPPLGQIAFTLLLCPCW